MIRSRRKVIHLITGLNVGGAELYLLRLLKNSDVNLIENQVISLRPIGLVGEQIRQLGIPVEGLNMQPSKPSLSGFIKLLKILIKEKPDVLMTWLYHADLLGLVAGKFAGVKSIIWNIRSSNMDMSLYHPLSAWVLWLCAFFSGFPSVVVINSQAGQRAHQKLGYRPRRWAWIPNGVDTREFVPDESAASRLRQSLDLDLKVPLVGMLARFDPMKDHATFLQAAGLVSSHMPEVHFLLAGTGCDAKNDLLNALINENALQGKIHLLGERNDAPAILAGLDVYMASSISEGFPNAIAEAMACGVPVVATDAGDTANILAGIGFVTSVRDATALADSSLLLLNETEIDKQNYRRLARKRAEENFNFLISIKKYEELFLEKGI